MAFESYDSRNGQIYVAGPIMPTRPSVLQQEIAVAYRSIIQACNRHGFSSEVPKHWIELPGTEGREFDYVRESIENSRGVVGFIGTGHSGPPVELGMAVALQKKILVVEVQPDQSRFLSSLFSRFQHVNLAELGPALDRFLNQLDRYL